MREQRVVVTDTNVLINLIHVDALVLLGRLEGFDFVMLPDVISEITQPAQAAILSATLDDGSIRQAALEKPEGLALYAELSRVMGRGESASLAWGIVENSLVACDDRRARREVIARLGEDRLVTTPGILLLAIRQRLITVDDADGMKATLETRRFKMAFGSFRELI